MVAVVTPQGALELYFIVVIAQLVVVRYFKRFEKNGVICQEILKKWVHF